MGSVVCKLTGVLCLAACLAATAQTDAPRAQSLQAGAARVTITPKGQSWIAGYESNRRSEGTIGELYASCLALKVEADQKPVVVVALDLIGLPNSEVNKIRSLLPDLPPENVLIACTHTHSGPDTIGLWGPNDTTTGLDAEYMQYLRQQIAECIKRAISSMRPAVLKLAGAVEVKGVSRNARVPQILDTELSALQAVELSGQPFATLVNFACHPEIFHGRKITADFPLYLYRRIEEKGGGIPLFLNGALGGMVTADVKEGANNETAWTEEAQRIGYALADAALEALGKAQPVAPTTLSIQRKVFTVPLENRRFKAAVERGIIPYGPKESPNSVTTEVTHLAVGAAEFVTVPGEALPNIGLFLKRIMKGSPKFVIGLCNDELGYILTEEDYGLKLYEYEASMSVGSQIGPMVKEQLRGLTASFTPPAVPAAQPALTVPIIFEYMPQGFNASAAQGVRAVYLWRVTGEGGGVWVVRIADGKCQVTSGPVANPDVAFEISAQDLLDLISGKLNGMEAVMTGRLKIEGDMNLAAQFAQFFTPR
ncbi:MAG: SCP2 sterol-binding domain-containing protein [Armatimonadota bacterium]